MTVLKAIERRIEGMFERGFRRAFRSNLQPVELARKLGREMEENKTVSVSRVYVPNEFTIYLAGPDREHFSAYESALTNELASYLAAQARAGGYAMVAAPRVALATDDDLRQGEFGIACRMVEAPPAAAPAPGGSSSQESQGIPAPTHGNKGAFRPAGAPVSSPRPSAPTAGPAEAGAAAAAPSAAGAAASAKEAVATPPTPPAPEPAPPAPPNPRLEGVSGTQVMSADEARRRGLQPEALTITTPSGSHRITKRVTTIGRSRDCDIVVADANASRLHAELRHSGQEYLIVDMGSTNGLEVNGRRAKRQAIADGDTITVGTTDLRVEVS